jgi:hypothetical protein
MGLAYQLTRYHRIASPDAPDKVQRDRPIECALCHTDASVEQLVTALEGWWPQRYDRAALQALYGADLGVNALTATVERGKPHEQAAAMAALGEARVTTAVPLLRGQLAHRLPLLRGFAKHALEQILGEPVPVDISSSAQAISATSTLDDSETP